MTVFKRGRTYWYEFRINGKRYKKSTRCSNRRDAWRVAAEQRLSVLSEACSEKAPIAVSPTFREFEPQFLASFDERSLSNVTRSMYLQSFKTLLDYERLSRTKLNDINEVIIAELVVFLRSKQLSNATVNRYIRILRMVLRHALKLGLIQRPPVFHLLRWIPRAPYVFAEPQYRTWLDCCPEPLKSMSILARQTGMRVGEMLLLEKQDVILLSEPDADGFFGEVLVKGAARRRLKLSRQLRDKLQSLISESMCEYVFTLPKYPTKALTKAAVQYQIAIVKTRADFPAGAGLHALRVTFIVELCRIADPFTAAKIAGHSLRTTMQFTAFMKVNWKALWKLLSKKNEE